MEQTNEQVNTAMPEQDLQERIAGFNNDLSPLLAKYELGLTGDPMITPDGRIVAKAGLVSTRGFKKQEEIETPPAITE